MSKLVPILETLGMNSHHYKSNNNYMKTWKQEKILYGHFLFLFTYKHISEL